MNTMQSHTVYQSKRNRLKEWSKDPLCGPYLYAIGGITLISAWLITICIL